MSLKFPLNAGRKAKFTHFQCKDSAQCKTGKGEPVHSGDSKIQPAFTNNPFGFNSRVKSFRNSRNYQINGTSFHEIVDTPDMQQTCCSGSAPPT